MQTFLVFLLYFVLVKCQNISTTEPPNSTELEVVPHRVINVTVTSVGSVLSNLIEKLTAYLDHLTTYPVPIPDEEIIPEPGRDILFYIFVALILVLLLISILTCCLILILLLCWQRRRQQQHKNQKDIERLPIVGNQTPQHLIIPPPQNNTVLKSEVPPSLLHRQPEVPHSPINSDPEIVGFRPIQSPEARKNAKSQNNEKPKKRSASEDPKLKKTVDAQKRTDTSSNVSSSTGSSPTSTKAKTPRQAKNGAISNKGVQTDYDTSDDEEFQNRVRGNETMPGRNIPSPRTELLV